MLNLHFYRYYHHPWWWLFVKLFVNQHQQNLSNLPQSSNCWNPTHSCKENPNPQPNIQEHRLCINRMEWSKDNSTRTKYDEKIKGKNVSGEVGPHQTDMRHKKYTEAKESKSWTLEPKNTITDINEFWKLTIVKRYRKILAQTEDEKLPSNCKSQKGKGICIFPGLSTRTPSRSMTKKKQSSLLFFFAINECFEHDARILLDFFSVNNIFLFNHQ